MPIGRRLFLIGSGALRAAASSRAGPRRPAPTAAALPPDFSVWNQEARGILSDGLETLRAFDVFQAFRVTAAAQSGTRLGAELAWDPPTSAAWDEATHLTRELHRRAEPWFESVTTPPLGPSLSRQHSQPT